MAGNVCSCDDNDDDSDDSNDDGNGCLLSCTKFLLEYCASHIV